MRKAIIGGTGVYEAFENASSHVILTAYGEASYDLVVVDGVEIIFLARHGKTHNRPPHKINYRANMMALKMLEVDEIYATCAVGSMNDHYEPGHVVLITDFIDFTKSRVQTFFEGDDDKVAHVEMTSPYCPDLSQRFLESYEKFEIDYKGTAVYVCTEGPRFETAAEIKMYHMLGGDIVGMTNVPECVLAKELGMCYSAIGVITNWCTGIEGKSIEGHQISASMDKNKKRLTDLFVCILTQSSSLSITENESKLENSSKPEHTNQLKTCKCNQSLIVL